MLDTQLARAVVAAIRPRRPADPGRRRRPAARASVPARCCATCWRAGASPAARLETVFRQAAQSRSCANAHRIRPGCCRSWRRPRRSGRASTASSSPRRAGRVAERSRPSGRPAACRASSASPAHEVQVLAPLTRVCQTLNGRCRRRSTRRAARPSVPTARCRCGSATGSSRPATTTLSASFNGDTGVVSGDRAPTS